MPYYRISAVVLYVVAALSILVMLFFYVGPRTVDIDELEARVEELTTAEDITEVDNEPVMDTTAVDTTASEEMGEEMMAEADSAAAPLMEEETTEPMEAETAVAGEIDLRDHLSGWELLVYKRTDYALGWAYILLFLTAIAAIVFPAVYLFTNVKALVKILALLAGAAVLFLLSYFVLASDTPIEILGYNKTDNSDPFVLRMVGTGLFVTYILFAFALVSILYSEVAKLFK